MELKGVRSGGQARLAPRGGDVVTLVNPTTHELETTCAIVGGGPAGYGAAIAALDGGCDTLVIERHGFLGGMGTVAGLSCYLNHQQTGADVADGIYRRLIADLAAIGGHYHDSLAHADFFEPESCKLIMEMAILRRGGKLLYYCLLEGVERTGDAWQLNFVCKGGRLRVRSRYLIDATGDGDVSSLAGAPMTHGRRSDGKTQPMSMVVQLAGFDPKAWSAAGGRLVDGRFAGDGDCFATEVLAARDAGEWTIPRNNVAMLWAMPSDPTRISINGTRIAGFGACNPIEMSHAEIEGRRQAQELVLFLRKRIPGFTACHLTQTGPQIGVRESRRIVGRATLTEHDVRGGAKPPSSVVFCSYPIDLHEPDGRETQFEKGQQDRIYGIPWECLLPESLENLVAAGRCISATHEAAGSFRVMPTCMGLGEAAGTAVALAARGHQRVSELVATEIRAAMDQSREPAR